MKKLQASLLIAALVFSSVLSASVAKKENSAVTLTEEIGNLLQNPDFKVDGDVFTSVDFILNKDHEIVVLSVDAPNSKIEGFIKKRLNYKSISNFYSKEQKQLKVPVRFTEIK
jgi:hypothetical protein